MRLHYPRDDGEPEAGPISESETFAVKALRRVYTPVMRFALGHRALTLAAVGATLLLAMLAGRGLGLEFLPHLEEGNFWIRASLPQAVSLEASDDYVNRMRAVIGRFPDVQTVVSQHGRPDDGTDATGFFNAEFFVPLKPFDTWPGHITKAQLTAKLNTALTQRFAGVDFNFSQNIEDNVEERPRASKAKTRSSCLGPTCRTSRRRRRRSSR